MGMSVMKQCAEILPSPPLEQKVLECIGIVLKFAEYVHHYKSLPWTIFGLIFEKQDGCHGHFFHVGDF